MYSLPLFWSVLFGALCFLSGLRAIWFLLNTYYWTPIIAVCILPWCPVRYLLHFWTNKLTDWLNMCWERRRLASVLTQAFAHFSSNFRGKKVRNSVVETVYLKCKWTVRNLVWLGPVTSENHMPGVQGKTGTWQRMLQTQVALFHDVFPLRQCTDKTLATRQLRTTLGLLRPVFGATLYNQRLGFSTDTEVTDT